MKLWPELRFKRFNLNAIRQALVLHGFGKPEEKTSRKTDSVYGVSHMWYPRTQEKRQNVFWGVISHITMACLSNISFSDNFVQKKK